MDVLFQELKQRTGYPRFPIAQPVHYTSCDPNVSIDLNDYFISNKFDGERLIAFYSSSAKSSDSCILINQRIEQRTLVELKFPRDLILDLEYCKNKFYVLDIINSKEPFEKRLEAIEKLVYSDNQTGLNCKQFAETKDFEILKLESNQELDGYIFSKKSGLVKFGRNPDFLKWKPFTELTVDLIYLQENLCVLNSSGYLSISKCNESFPDLNQNDVVECFPVKTQNKVTWHFKKFRLDKNKPNFITTYQSILKEILLPKRRFETIEKVLKK